MTDIDIDKRFDRLQDAADTNKRLSAEYAERLDALEAEVRALKRAMDTLIETAPAPSDAAPHE